MQVNKDSVFDLFEKALKNNKLGAFIRGDEGYALPEDGTCPMGLPTNHNLAWRWGFCEYYMRYPTSSICQLLEDTLASMLVDCVGIFCVVSFMIVVLDRFAEENRIIYFGGMNFKRIASALQNAISKFKELLITTELSYLEKKEFGLYSIILYQGVLLKKGADYNILPNDAWDFIKDHPNAESFNLNPVREKYVLEMFNKEKIRDYILYGKDELNPNCKL